MILSVSRRTDIPNYYSEWFYNRIKEGYLYVRNPINTHQISKINLSPDMADCIVFWTKNPANMIPRLDELRDYNYCFQFTLTGYGTDIEANIPDKRHNIIGVFQNLSKITGSEKIIWRYDPILFNESYDPAYHLKAFEEIAGELKGYTKRVIISLIDFYEKTKRNTTGQNIRDITYNELAELAQEMNKIARKNNLELTTCAAQNRLTGVGISCGGCVEKAWIEEITGCRLKANREKNQRKGCECIESIDIGTYNTCMNGCRYCYANYSEKRVSERVKLYDAHAPLLCGHIEPGDKITERKVKSFKEIQRSLFDL